MEGHEIIGFIAGFGTTFAAAPDLYAMLKRKSAQGMNPTMAGIMGVFQIAWLYYGVLIDSMPIIIWNIIAYSSVSTSVSSMLMEFEAASKLVLTRRVITG